jgi:hypothetical protein
MKNPLPFSCTLWFQENVLLVKIKEQGFFKKKLGSRIRKNSSRIRIPDPGGKKHRIPYPDPQHLNVYVHHKCNFFSFFC